jgi:hypothetical protein
VLVSRFVAGGIACGGTETKTTLETGNWTQQAGGDEDAVRKDARSRRMLRASGTPDMREPTTVASGKQETAAQRGKGWEVAVSTAGTSVWMCLRTCEAISTGAH